jgi:hypothetical protein
VSGDRTRPPPAHSPPPLVAGAGFRRGYESLELGLDARIADLADLERQAGAVGRPPPGALGGRRAPLRQPHNAAVAAEIGVAQVGWRSRPSSGTTVCSKGGPRVPTAGVMTAWARESGVALGDFR